MPFFSIILPSPCACLYSLYCSLLLILSTWLEAQVMALTDVMQQTSQVTACQLTEMCLRWAHTASCLTVTARHLLTSCTELPDSSSGSIYSPGIWPDPCSPTSLSIPGVMQHLWLKCELERHTHMVVSLDKREVLGQRRGGSAGRRCFFRTVYGPIPCNTLL